MRSPRLPPGSGGGVGGDINHKHYKTKDLYLLVVYVVSIIKSPTPIQGQKKNCPQVSAKEKEKLPSLPLWKNR